MTKGRGICLLLILAALAAGMLIGYRMKPDRMAMMVTRQGKVYPSPKEGDVLYWIDHVNTEAPVTWDGPHANTKSPCEDTQTTSPTCKVKFKTSIKNFMYHYVCTGCGDPSVPGPRSGGGPGDSSATKAATNVLSAVAALNNVLSGVWYFAPDGGAFKPIPVSTYSDPTKFDVIAFDPATDDAGTAVRWKVCVNPKTCKEQDDGAVIGSDGVSTCTILNTAASQNYSVLYANNNVGVAQLVVNGVAASGALPACSY